ncbi:MAG: hypothetical protein ABR529_09090 [Actinomycetota bacterium]
MFGERSKSKVERLTEELKAKVSAANELSALVESENRNYTAAEQNTLKGLLDEARDIKGKLDQSKKDEAVRKSLDEFGESIFGGDETSGRSRSPAPAVEVPCG